MLPYRESRVYINRPNRAKPLWKRLRALNIQQSFILIIRAGAFHGLLIHEVTLKSLS